jgi:hypothetical protein
MHSIWLKGHRNKQKRKEEVLGARWAFDLLREVLNQEFRKDAVRDYEQPNWAERQIAANEYNHALDDLIKLITLEKEK